MSERLNHSNGFKKRKEYAANNILSQPLVNYLFSLVLNCGRIVIKCVCTHLSNKPHSEQI